MVQLNNPKSAGKFRRCPINYHDTTDVHLVVHSDTSSGVDNVEYFPGAGCLPLHLLIGVLEIGSGSAQREGQFGRVVGEGERCGFRHRDDAESVRRIGDLDPKHLSLERIVGLG